MKKLHRIKSVSIPDSRWLAYATASLATSLAGAQSAHAEIHYSGLLNIFFKAPFHDSPAHRRFPLNNGSAYFVFVNRLHPTVPHSVGRRGVAGFLINGPVSGQFAGTVNDHYQVGYVSDLQLGDNISTRPFTPNIAHHGYYSDFKFGVLVNHFLYYYCRWGADEVAYVGFKFDAGSGVQYGWARVQIAPFGIAFFKGNFKLIDYAYGDVGDSLTAGQTETAPASQAGKAGLPDRGSLGLLAVGGAGLIAWRRSRSRRCVGEQS